MRGRMSEEVGVRIGELAREFGLNPRTLRYLREVAEVFRPRDRGKLPCGHVRDWLTALHKAFGPSPSSGSRHSIRAKAWKLRELQERRLSDTTSWRM